MAKAKCWCGKRVLEEVGGIPLGFLSCPVHYSYCQPDDWKEFLTPETELEVEGEDDV